MQRDYQNCKRYDLRNCCTLYIKTAYTPTEIAWY